METRNLLTQRGAIKRLNLNVATFRKLRADGEIKPIGMIEGKFFVFDEADVNDLARRLTPKHIPFQSRLAVATKCKRIN